MAANESRVLVILDPENVGMTGWQESMASIEALGMEPTFKIAAAAKDGHISDTYRQAILDAGFELDLIETTNAKDGADICLISRALQIYYRSGFDVVCFISYDTDFQYLARILKEEGVHTIGFEGEKLSSIIRPYFDTILEPTPERLVVPDELVFEIKGFLRTPALVNDQGWMHFETAVAMLNSAISRAMGPGISLRAVLDSIEGVVVKADPSGKHQWVRLDQRRDNGTTPAYKKWKIQRMSALLDALVASYDDLVQLTGHPLVNYRDLLAHTHKQFGVPAHWVPKMLEYSKKDVSDRLNDLVPHLEFHGWTEGNMLVVRPEYKALAA